MSPAIPPYEGRPMFLKIGDLVLNTDHIRTIILKGDSVSLSMHGCPDSHHFEGDEAFALRLAFDPKVPGCLAHRTTDLMNSYPMDTMKPAPAQTAGGV